MNTRKSSVTHDAGYAGLTKITNGLPTSYYLDDAHHRREMASIWRNNWVYACRSSEVPASRSYRTFELGDQSIFLVRDETGVLRGFYNTCRHRGAALCPNTQGKFPPAGIVCPYHNWRYGLQGQLRQTSSHLHPEGFEVENFSLYKVAVTEWNGLVFVALTPEPPPFGNHFDQPLQRFDSWRLGELVSGHTFRKVVACNWKVFWENYNECLHCPGVHPRLSQLVPIFARGLQDERDDPHWQQHADEDDPQYRGGLRHGAQSWTMDGKPVGVPFPGLSDSDRKTGQLYMTCLPSAFIVAHIDYVRVVRLRPLATEQTELSVEFLFRPETLQNPARDIASAVEFTDIVMKEDAEVCELNQRGLRAAPHQHGVVMPEEHLIAAFQEWVKAQLAVPPPGATTARSR